MQTIRFIRPAVAVVALCACSGAPKIDPCGPASAGLQLHVVSNPAAAVLSWNATTAQSYVVDVLFATLGESQVQVDGTSVTMPNENGRAATYQLHAVAAGNVCLAVSSVDVPRSPLVDAQVTDDGVALQWGSLGVAGAVERGPDVDHLVPIANAATTFLDTSAADTSTYVYRVRFHVSDAVDVVSSTANVVTLLPPPTNVTVQETSSTIAVGWKPPVGATSCSVFNSGPLGASQPLVTVQRSTATTATLTQCAAGHTCSFDVRCSDRVRSSHPARVSAIKAPSAPFGCAAAPALGGPQLTWFAPPNAGTFRIERAPPGQSPIAVGTVAGTSIVDVTAPLFEAVSYRVFAIAPDGAADASSFCTTEPAFAVNAPDVANTGVPVPSVGIRAPGQIFTVQHGGQLMGIEVLSNAIPETRRECFDVFATTDPQAVPVLSSGTDCATLAVPQGRTTLDPTLVAGEYYDLSSRNLLVSAGETLRFEIVSNAGFPVTADAVAGTATLFGGSVVPGADMIFKVYVLPSAVAVAPQLQAAVSGGQAVLTWTADPTAQGYDVVDSHGAVALHTADTHAAVSIPAGGETYFVRSASAAALASAPVSVQPSTIVTAAENLCADSTGARDDNLAFDTLQTFVAEASGLLTRVDLALDPLVDTTVGVEDVATGTTLASATMHPRTTWTQYAFAPLSDTTPGIDFVDLSASGAHVAQGQSLRIRVHSAGFAAYTFRDGPDTYPAGAEVRSDGVARDMCFKVYLDSAR